VRPTPSRVDLGDDVLAAIRARLRSATLPAPRGSGWEHGVSIEYLEQFRRYWLDEFDWAAAQERLNAHPQFRATIDGLEIHFYWVRGSGAGSRPLLLTHGWPGSVVEFLPVIDALAHPGTSGGESADSFDVVVPSLPGFGFSGRPEGVVGPQSTVRLWRRLMTDVLGYERFGAQGGDLGSMVTAHLGGEHADVVSAIHLNFVPIQRDFAHRRRGDGDAETLELADDPAVSPVGILPRESQDQRSQRRLERRPPRLLVRIRPASGDQLAVPPQQRLGLHREARPRPSRQ
jgi:pimeloyl-ACP methyl ester carboxylesterase